LTDIAKRIFSSFIKNKLTVGLLLITGCASITNEPLVPIELSFVDGEDGVCILTNKRGSWSTKVPSTVKVRRSDDSLNYDCTAKNNKKAFGYIESGVDSTKILTSVAFIDLGLTDVITDMHRTYPGKFVIQLK
jgi:hypothetical protein